MFSSTYVLNLLLILIEIRSDQIKSNQICSDQIRPDQTRPDQIRLLLLLLLLFEKFKFHFTKNKDNTIQEEGLLLPPCILHQYERGTYLLKRVAPLTLHMQRGREALQER